MPMEIFMKAIKKKKINIISKFEIYVIKIYSKILFIN